MEQTARLIEKRRRKYDVMRTVSDMPLTDFLTVVGQPSSNTGPLSVLLILNRSEKLIGRM